MSRTLEEDLKEVLSKIRNREVVGIGKSVECLKGVFEPVMEHVFDEICEDLQNQAITEGEALETVRESLCFSCN